MHAAAKWLVLRVPAAAKAEVLPRRTVGWAHVVSKFVDESDAT
jgi:hypothetical protein